MDFLYHNTCNSRPSDIKCLQEAKEAKQPCGCPKLDGVDYADKLTLLFRDNRIRSVTVTRMTVPCCGGLTHAVKTAIANSGKDIPLQIVTVSPDGRII